MSSPTVQATRCSCSGVGRSWGCGLRTRVRTSDNWSRLSDRRFRCCLCVHPASDEIGRIDEGIANQLGIETLTIWLFVTSALIPKPSRNTSSNFRRCRDFRPSVADFRVIGEWPSAVGQAAFHSSLSSSVRSTVSATVSDTVRPPSTAMKLVGSTTMTTRTSASNTGTTRPYRSLVKNAPVSN